MKNTPPSLRSLPRRQADVVTLTCVDQMLFDPTPLVRLFAEADPFAAEEVICRMLEDMALRLDDLQGAMARNAFDKMRRPARRIELVAHNIGLIELSAAAAHVAKAAAQDDGVALDATMARLERGFDMAVSEVWRFRDMT